MSYDLTRANLSNLSWSLDDEGQMAELAEARGWVSKAQLEECFREQRKTSPPAALGSILIGRGLVTADQLAQLRSEQARLEDEARAAARVLPSGLPSRIGPYRLVEILGEGGMGLVFRARDEQLGRDVALKMLKTVQAFSPIQAERFQREERAAARLSHPGIVKVLDIGRHGDVPYYTMELVTGRPLGEFAGDLVARVRVLEKVARAVQHAHDQGIIHRDLKPQNVLVDDKGEPHLLDFGLSRDLAATHDLTRSGAFLGTPFYMAPEQARGRIREIDARTDVYALGVILYQMLAGKVPFEGTDASELTQRIVAEDPARPPGPEALVTICLKAMEKEPARRYASAAAMADDLGRYASGGAVEARSPSVIYKMRRSAFRHRLRIAAAVSIVVGVGALALSFRPVHVEAAFLDAAEGEVFLLNADGRSPARSGARLVPGQGIETAGTSSRASVRYEDGTRLEIEGPARLRFNASPPGKSLSLDQGRVRVLLSVQPDGRPFGLSSPKAEAKSREADFSVSVTSEWTRVETARGSVRLTRQGDGAAVDVAAGRYAIAESGVELAARAVPPEDRIPRDGLQLWLRADSGVGLQDGRVSRWEDQSGQGNHAAQDIVSRRPRMGKDAIGGKPALQFDEAQWLIMPAGFREFSGGVSAFVLARPVSPKPVFMEIGNRDRGSGEPMGLFRLRLVGNTLFYETEGTPGGPKKVTLDAPAASAHGRYQSFGIVHAATGEATVYRNGAALAGGKLPLPTSQAKWRNLIGEENGPYEFRGDLAEVLVYGRALNDAERKDVEAYLYAKYLDPGLASSPRGLAADYFPKEDLSGAPIRRVDSRIDFEWHDAPDLGLSRHDRFSVRWNGTIEARSDEPFTLVVRTNHGLRLWVDGALAVEKDTNQEMKEWEAAVTPRADRRHRITMEHFYTKQTTQGAVWGRRIALLWSSPTLPREVVPQSRLTPAR